MFAEKWNICTKTKLASVKKIQNHQILSFLLILNFCFPNICIQRAKPNRSSKNLDADSDAPIKTPPRSGSDIRRQSLEVSSEAGTPQRADSQRSNNRGSGMQRLDSKESDSSAGVFAKVANMFPQYIQMITVVIIQHFH